MAARLEHPDGRSLRLWWRLPVDWAHALTGSGDPFVVGLLFPMMQWQMPVRVVGRASPSLLANLEQFMAVWHLWFPDMYRPVPIAADEEVEPSPLDRPGQTVVPFSCGVDSSFTLLRHRQGLAGRRNRSIAAAVVLNGFDIWLDQPNAQAMYAGLLDDARQMLASQAVPCIPLTGNFHELPTLWKHSFGTHLVSGLMLLQGRFDSMLIPNNVDYKTLARRWASHPVTDPMLGSASFTVDDDGPECDRPEKLQLLSTWPEALRLLRVCFSNPGTHANCCRCEKCLRTMLCFQALGLPVPESFARPPSPRDIRRVRFPHRENIVLYWREILAIAGIRGLARRPWARAARAAIRRNRLRWFLGALKRPLIPLRNHLRRLFRGSPLSRGKLAKRPPEGWTP